MADEEQPRLDPAVLAALDDESCRCIIETATNEPQTAKEIAELCDLPLSSTYRKLDRLVEAGIVEESTRVRLHEKHVTEYETVVGQVIVTIDAAEGLRTEIRVRSDRDGTSETPPPEVAKPTTTGLKTNDGEPPDGHAETDVQLPVIDDIDDVESVAVSHSDRVVVVTRTADGNPGDEQPVTD